MPDFTQTKKIYKGGIDNAPDSESVYYRTYSASPIFSFLNSSLSSAGSYLIDLETATPQGDVAGACLKFLPLTNMTISNSSTEDIYVYLNQANNAKVIPAGTILSFTKGTISAIRSIKVYNAGSNTIDANKIEIAVYKEGIVIDDAFKNLHKALYKALYSWRR